MFVADASATVNCNGPSGAPTIPEGATEYSSLEIARTTAEGMNARTGTGRSQLAHADEASIQPVQVGSLPGATYISSIRLGQLTGRIKNLYVATPKCAWHVAISIFSPGDESAYFSLFDRIIQTFQPQGAA